MITIYCGLFFISRVEEDDPNIDINSDFIMTKGGGAEYTLFFTIITANLLFIVVWVVKFVMTMK